MVQDQDQDKDQIMGGMLSSDLRRVQFDSKGTTKTFNLDIEPGDGNQFGNNFNGILITPAVTTRFQDRRLLNVQFKKPEETTEQIDPESHLMVQNTTNLDMDSHQSELMVENKAENIQAKTEVKIDPETISITIAPPNSSAKSSKFLPPQTQTPNPNLVTNQTQNQMPSENEEIKFSNYEREREQQ